MARQPMITRTITTTKCNVLCMDIENQKPVTTEVVLPRTYKNEKAMLDKLATLIWDENLKPVHVSSYEVQETLYGMEETVFIANAKVMPTRATKD